MRRLEYHELKRFCDSGLLGFDTTATDALDVSKNIIGQSRAVASFNFGLATRRKGYNIYVSGVTGSGKTTFAKHFAQIAAANDPAPRDLCYVYNFKDAKHPKLLSLKSGTAVSFKEDLEEMLDVLLVEIPKAFEQKDFEEQRSDIVKKFEKQRDQEMRGFVKEAKEMGFEVRYSDKGMVFSPIVDGVALSVEEFENLEEEKRDEISEKSGSIQTGANKVMAKIRSYDIKARKHIDELEYNVALFTVGRLVAKLQEKYQDEQGVLDYLVLLKEDILDNIGGFHADGDGDEEEGLQQLLPWIAKKAKEDVLSKYRVNILTDNSGATGAPVHLGVNPTYANIMGEVEFDSEFGNLTTDYMKIKPGLVHKANGGYLILQAKDVLSIPFLWDGLKRTIATGEITIENPKEHAASIPVAGIKPEAVAFDIKIILVGASLYHELLRGFDEDFCDLFKVLAFFDYEMDYNADNIREICSFIKRFVKEEQTFDFDAGAVAAVIEYSSRLAGSQKKLTSRFDRISETLTEAYIWAKRAGETVVMEKYVKEAIKQHDYRLNLYEEKMGEMIESDIIMINTSGGKIGEINGLAAIDTGDYIFAKPTKITATTYVGKAGIVNIENEAQMSGEIHDKGTQIIIGYLGQKYAQHFPLSLSCRVCFEQNYSSIDGDSASSTELYCVLSSLAQIPINQEIAVTGSINQRGEIQAVGAITPKIEGFFDLCQKRGLTGTQGVIIPRQNVPDLVLNDDVIKAVRDGRFHIYAISGLDEGIEILMGMKAGEITEEGSADTIHGLVFNRLRDFYERSLEE
ncbi:MAG: AAA family ATPase [Clostridiales bacterium]|jgi:lon-related putative ATP-dependent protease|nr:AAA family ATPase [Clostridiales bacterium]